MAGFFDTMFGGGAEREAAEKNRALAGQYGTDAQGYLKTGYDTGTTNVNKAIGAYDPLATLGAKYNKAGRSLSRCARRQRRRGQRGGDLGLPECARLHGRGDGGPRCDQPASRLDRHVRQRQRRSGRTRPSRRTLQNQQYNTWLQNLAGARPDRRRPRRQRPQPGRRAATTTSPRSPGQYAQNQTGVAGTQLGANTSANTLQAQGEASGAKNLLGAGLSLASLAAGGGLGGIGAASVACSARPGLGGAVSGMLRLRVLGSVPRK
jgi:hypothetical protein